MQSLEQELVQERRNTSDAQARQQQRKSRQSIRDSNGGGGRKSSRRQSSFLPPPSLLEEDEDSDAEEEQQQQGSTAIAAEPADAQAALPEIEEAEMVAVEHVRPKGGKHRASVCILPGGEIDDIDDLVDPVF